MMKTKGSFKSAKKAGKLVPNQTSEKAWALTDIINLIVKIIMSI